MAELLMGNSVMNIEDDEQGVSLSFQKNDQIEQIFRFWLGYPLIMASMNLYDADGVRSAVLNKNAWNYNDGGYEINTHPRHLTLTQGGRVVVELDQPQGEDRVIVRHLDVYTKQKCRVMLDEAGDFVILDRRGLLLIQLSQSWFVSNMSIVLHPFSPDRPPSLNGSEIHVTLGYSGATFQNCSFES